jgi:iron complex outermembrane receptor protein/vitamin B12 transporter
MYLLVRRPRPIRRIACSFAILSLLFSSFMQGRAAEQGSLHGTVRDPLGAVIAGATVELLNGTTVITTMTTDAEGNYAFHLEASGRYRVRAVAQTFRTTTSQPIYATKSKSAAIDVTLSTQTLTQQVSVTATAVPTPVAQIGASVTVLNAEDYRQFTEVQDPLRLVPGLQLTQTGQAGGTTGLSIRGGNTDANKVLIDGVPVNDIGGAVEFANFATVGIQKIEVLREPNSALYGSDALAGVVSMTTARGTTTLPLFSYAGDGGNFSTFHQELAASGVLRQFDYYGGFAREDSRNNLPNDAFHNGTYTGNFGWNPNATNELRFTVRHLSVSAGQPNAILLYGIPDDAAQKAQNTYYSGVWNNETTTNWHNEIRYGGLRLRSQFDDFAATGIPDPAGSGNFLGAPVTITGANGYSVSGQAIFQFAGTTYPNQFLAVTDRDFVYAQSDYRFNPHVLVLGAFKYEAERGSTLSTGLPLSSISRGNYSYTVQISGDIRNRLYYNVGSGIEDNGLFGWAGTPRASLAYYLVRPSASHWLSGTKLHASFGKGIKEPNIAQQASSLFDILSDVPDGGALIAQFHVGQIGAESSRTYDGGVDQELWNGRARLGVTYFHNEFTNGIEFVPQTGLAALGVPAANLPALQGGAYINSQAFRSQGVELETEYRINNQLFARGGYTYTDAVVQRSFSSDQGVGESFNPSSNFRDIPIGAFSPLVGARPFRVAPHSGYFGLNYTHSKFYSSLTGTLVGRRDDSDFLSDADFGPTLLLPNRNLDGAYQRLDVSGGYQVTPRLAAYTDIQNVLSEHYAQAFGFPSLPFTFRSGIRINFGGESWGLK